MSNVIVNVNLANILMNLSNSIEFVGVLKNHPDSLNEAVVATYEILKTCAKISKFSGLVGKLNDGTLNASAQVECVKYNLRLAHNCLNQMIGDVVPDDVIDSIEQIKIATDLFLNATVGVGGVCID